jgi:hypothetical protein
MFLSEEQAMSQKRKDLNHWPLWHFAHLTAALKRGDNRRATDALRQLRRLGIEVRFTLPPARKGDRHAQA